MLNVRAAPIRSCWTLAKEARRASAALYPHPLGVELRVDVDGEVWRTEAHRQEDAADASARAWRVKFEAKGWTALNA